MHAADEQSALLPAPAPAFPSWASSRRERLLLTVVAVLAVLASVELGVIVSRLSAPATLVTSGGSSADESTAAETITAGSTSSDDASISSDAKEEQLKAAPSSLRRKHSSSSADSGTAIAGAGDELLELKISRAGKFQSQMHCELDPRVTPDNIKSYIPDLPAMWASTCGLNRGIFVLDSHPGQTFTCGQPPTEWGLFNGMGELFGPGRSHKKDLAILKAYIKGVFATSQSVEPGSCEFSGFGLLRCGADRDHPYKRAPWAHRLNYKPIRGVNMGGLFVLEPWITPGLTSWGDDVRDQYTFCTNPHMTLDEKLTILNDHWANWYTADDFKHMKALGLNSVRLPVGWWYFAESAGFSSKPYLVPDPNIDDASHPLARIISLANEHNIQVLLDLHGAPKSQNGLDNSGRRSMNENPEEWGDLWFFSATVRARTVRILQTMTRFINKLNSRGVHNVMAIELLNEPWVFNDMSVARDFYIDAIRVIRKVNASLPIVLSDAFRHDEWNWLLAVPDFDWSNVVMDTHLYHAFNPADIASSSARCDKIKQVVNENIACGYGDLLRFKTCSSLPTLTGEWSLAIDDCMRYVRGSPSTATQFKDYGQCQNLHSRKTDKAFWAPHTASFGARQIFTFERELGWFFWTYKTGVGSELDPSMPYWNYKEAVKQGYLPKNLNTFDFSTACDHPAQMPQDGLSMSC